MIPIYRNLTDNAKANAIIRDFIHCTLKKLLETYIGNKDLPQEDMANVELSGFGGYKVLFPFYYSGDLCAVQLRDLYHKIMADEECWINSIQCYSLYMMVQQEQKSPKETGHCWKIEPAEDRAYALSALKAMKSFKNEKRLFGDDDAETFLYNFELLQNWEDYLFKDTNFLFLGQFQIKELFLSRENKEMALLSEADYKSCLNIVD